jgi:hypothetical protein
MIAITNIESTKLDHLDISYSKMVTDEGLNAFEGKEFPIKHLNFSGCTGVTGKGLYHPIFAAR